MQAMWAEHVERGCVCMRVLLCFCFASALLLLCLLLLCFALIALPCIALVRFALLCFALHCILRSILLRIALLCIALLRSALLCFFVFICNNQHYILNKYVMKSWTSFSSCLLPHMSVHLYVSISLRVCVIVFVVPLPSSGSLKLDKSKRRGSSQRELAEGA